MSIYGEILAERTAQQNKWGEQNHPNVDDTLMNREPGGCTAQRMAQEYEIPTADRAKFMCQTADDLGEVTYAHIALEEFCEAVEAATTGSEAELRAELVQCAAVFVAWIETIDRGKQP